MKTLLLSILITLTSYMLFSQTIIFENLEGEELITAIRENYRPTDDELQSYRDGRAFLYTQVFNTDDTLRAFYTGHCIPLDRDASDPTGEVFLNGSADGINAEHVYPRGKGADDVRNNMYNVVPCRVAVNSARASHPFGDIPDHETTRWYIKDQTKSSIPTSDIDLYSELRGAEFEPKEEVKGDVARIMFYFYTIYFEEAQREDPEYFEPMKATLCRWAADDPVDEMEHLRNQQIAAIQGDKSNPFVDDCSVLDRSYCSGLALDYCESVSTLELDLDQYDAKIWGNGNVLNFELGSLSSLRFHVFSMSGQTLTSGDITHSHESINLSSQLSLEPQIVVVKIETEYGSTAMTIRM